MFFSVWVITLAECECCVISCLSCWMTSRQNCNFLFLFFSLSACPVNCLSLRFFPVIWQLFQAYCCKECFYLALKCINILKKKCLLDVIGPSLLWSSLYNLVGNNLYVSDAFDLKVSIFPFSAVLFCSACRYIFCIPNVLYRTLNFDHTDLPSPIYFCLFPFFSWMWHKIEQNASHKTHKKWLWYHFEHLQNLREY